MRASICVVLVLAGCSSSVDPPETPAKQASAISPSNRGRLQRSDVVRVVDGGLGRFLQHVIVEPSVEQGRFQGFRILSLQPAEFWSDVDLREGDVVTQVNGQSIEVPEKAFEVFESLRSAPAVRVWLVRDGQPRELVLPIEGAPVNDDAPPETQKPQKAPKPQNG